ncbi:uncharacterized protein isoform X2 [Leptinotarsa decemlineata]|uniref:uncharacterized protein isoform X2 n=1 Tax=Leptinotarsa decemlineata TaxID=7539 RepID=UPI003D306FEC
MNKSKRRVSKKKDEEEESDESVESLLLEEGVKKLLDIDIDGHRRKNIFINTEENPQRIRRSIITRALRNVISSTPMITKTNGKFFSTECSLDISPINSETDEHSVREDIKKNDLPEKKILHQPQNVEPDVLSVSSDASEIKDESAGVAKHKDLPIKTHFTRGSSRQSGEKSPVEMKTDKEHTHFTRTKNQSKKNQKHIGMPELLNSSKNNFDVKSSDSLSRVSNISKGLAHTKTVNEVEMESGENVSDKSEEIFKSPRLIESVDKGEQKTAERVYKSPYRTEIDKTPPKMGSKSSENVSRLTNNLSKSPHLTEVSDETTDGIEYKSGGKIHKITQNLSKSPGIKITQKGNTESKSNGKSKNHSLGHNDFSEKLVGTKTFPYILRNSEGLTTIQESEDIRTPTRTADWIRQSSVSLRNSRQNVTLRKSSRIENTQNFTFKKQSNTIIKEQPDISDKNVENLQEKSSKIPVLRTRSKSREKTGKSESRMRLESSGERKQLDDHSSKRNEELLLRNPPKPAPRRRKQRKSLVKSIQNSIPKVDDENIQPNLQTTLQSSKTNDMLQKYFTQTNTNLSAMKKLESAEGKDFSVINAAKSFAERSTSPRKRSSVILSCPKQKTFDFEGDVGTGISSLSFSHSSPSIDKEERCRRLDILIDKLSEQKSSVDIGVGYSKKFNTEPSSNLVAAKVCVTQHKKVQTSLWNSDEAKRKAKKTCARNIFTKSIAETEPCGSTNQNSTKVHTQKNQTDINDDNESLCSGKTDSSKMLDEYDGFNLFHSLEEEPFCPETFSSFKNFDDPELMNERTPWRFEDQLLSQSSKRISIKLNFLKDANKIEEEKALLSKEDIENVDHINRNQKNILPRLKSTFRDYTHKSTRKNVLEPPRMCEEKTRNSFSDCSSDNGVCGEDIEDLENSMNHSRRMILEAEQQQNIDGEGCESEENTLIEESNLQSSQIHNITKSRNGNAQGENLISSQTSRVMTPSRSTIIKKDQIVITKKSDAQTQKSNGQRAADSTEKENYVKENLQEDISPSRSQKNVESSEDQLKNKPNDENDQEKDNCYHTPAKYTINCSKNSFSKKDARTICDMNQSKRRVTDALIHKNCVQNDEIETNLNQIHLRTSTNKRKSKDILVETETEVNSYSGSKKHSFQIENNKKVDSRGKFSENLSPAPDLVTGNNHQSPVCQSEPIENVADKDTAESFLGTHNKRQLSVILRKFSEKTIGRKLHEIQRILDGEEEEDMELLSNKNSPTEKNQFEGFNDLAVPLGQTVISTIFSEGGDNANEESQPGSNTKNLKLKDKKNTDETVFKVPKTKSHKTRKRNFTNESDDVTVDSEASSLTGTRRSCRDRKPPKRRYVMEFLDDVVTSKPPKKPVTRKTKLSKRKSSETVEQQQEHIIEGEEKRIEEKKTSRKEDQPKKRITKTRGRKKGVTTTVTLTSAHSSDEKDSDSVKELEVSNKRPKRNNKTKSDSIQIETVAQIHTMSQVNSFNAIDTASSHSPEDFNNFETVEDYQNTDDMCLRTSNQENMISQDSGTSTLLRSNTFEVSNLQTTKTQGKINKPKNKKISKVCSQSVPVPQINEVNIPSNEDGKIISDSLIENECVEILSGSEVIKLKYVENDPKFRVCQDDLSLTDFMGNVSGTTMGYLKLPSKGMKPVHTARKHALCYFVLEGEGRIQVHNRTSTVRKMSHFFIPLGVEYAIMNDGTDDMLLACVRIVST